MRTAFFVMSRERILSSTHCTRVRFSMPTSLRSSKQNSQEDVVDVGYCTPTLVHVCEDLHGDEVDMGDVPWMDWHMDDPGLEGDDETY